MLQKSVYSKLLLNRSSYDAVLHKIKKAKLKEGLVQVLMVTERQFNKMELIVGAFQTDVLNSSERLVVL